jgi:hypothetical protein
VKEVKLLEQDGNVKLNNIIMAYSDKHKEKRSKLEDQVRRYNDIQYFYKGTKPSGKLPILDQQKIT